MLSPLRALGPDKAARRADQRDGQELCDCPCGVCAVPDFDLKAVLSTPAISSAL